MLCPTYGNLGITNSTQELSFTYVRSSLVSATQAYYKATGRSCYAIMYNLTFSGAAHHAGKTFTAHRSGSGARHSTIRPEMELQQLLVVAERYEKVELSAGLCRLGGRQGDKQERWARTVGSDSKGATDERRENTRSIARP